MSAPIEVLQRPKGAGLGTIDEKTPQQKKATVLVSSDEESESDDNEEEEEEDHDDGARWKKGIAVSLHICYTVHHCLLRSKVLTAIQQPRRRKIKTVYEVINETEEEKPQLVVDMRGPQVRTMTDVSSALRAGDDKKLKAGPMPELRYNMRLLVDMSELNIQNIDRNLRCVPHIQ